MRILFIRHGDPNYAIDSLTDKGKIESKLLAKKLSEEPIKTVYVSPLGRAQKTAKYYLKLSCKISETKTWLKEFDGFIINQNNKKVIPWDLMPSYISKNPKLYDNTEWADTDIMQSGNVKERYNYVCSSFDELLSEHGYIRENLYYRVKFANTDTLAFFCHFEISSVLLSHLTNISPVLFWQHFCAAPSSIISAITEEREKGIASFRINEYGDISHLKTANEKPSFSARFCEIYNSKDRH